jgi:hypothetical protein
MLREGVPRVIGRREPSDVRIADATLSREHARFTLAEGSVLVEDLGSTNGTWVGGRRVERATLAGGDEVMLGKLTARVHAQPSPERIGGSEGDPALAGRRAQEGERARDARRGAAAGGEARGGEEAPVSGARMRAVLAEARRFAAARVPVILRGETGSGKEVARAVRSARLRSRRWALDREGSAWVRRRRREPVRLRRDVSTCS